MWFSVRSEKSSRLLTFLFQYSEIRAFPPRTVAVVDADHLHRRVLERQAGDGGRVEPCGLEERMRLLLAPVGALSVPPPSALRVQHRAGGALDGDVATGNRHQRALPLGVTERRASLEGDLRDDEIVRFDALLAKLGRLLAI